MKRIIRRLKKSFRKKVLKLKYKKYWILVPIPAFGDAFVTFSLIRAFKEKNGGKVLILTNKESIKNLAKLFSDIDAVIFSPFVNLENSDEPIIGKPYYINFYQDFHGIKSRHMLSRAKLFLGLDENAKPVKPTTSKKVSDKIAAMIKELNPENKSLILLSPDAVTVDSEYIGEDFWNELAKKFTDLNFLVIFNVDGRSNEKYSRYKKIFLPIEQMIVFSQKCHAIVGLRSGFLDVLAGSVSTKIICLYHVNHLFKNFKNDEKIKAAFETQFLWNDDLKVLQNYINLCSLIDMYDNKNIAELIFEKNKNEEELMSKIIELSKISQKN